MKTFICGLICICFSGISLAQDSIKITERESNGTDKILAAIDASTPGREAFISQSFSEACKIEKDDRTNLGPDASYVQIDIKFKKDKITLVSWHPLYESNGKIVATSHGLEALDGRKLDEVIKMQSQEYQYFRKTFDSICANAKKAAEQGASANP